MTGRSSFIDEASYRPIHAAFADMSSEGDTTSRGGETTDKGEIPTEGETSGRYTQSSYSKQETPKEQKKQFTNIFVPVIREAKKPAPESARR